ncbi:MAG TPA: hypothetical protein VH599_07390 [Ktedonobacterales bacterium]|jgi:hypothetical protein
MSETIPQGQTPSEHRPAPVNLETIIRDYSLDALAAIEQHAPTPYTKADMARAAYDDEAERMRGYNDGREDTLEVARHFLGGGDKPIPQGKDAEKVQAIREFMPGAVLGTELTPFLTDEEVLEYVNLKDQLAALHNAAFERWKRNKRSADKPSETER